MRAFLALINILAVLAFATCANNHNDRTESPTKTGGDGNVGSSGKGKIVLSLSETDYASFKDQKFNYTFKVVDSGGKEIVSKSGQYDPKSGFKLNDENRTYVFSDMPVGSFEISLELKIDSTLAYSGSLKVDVRDGETANVVLSLTPASAPGAGGDKLKPTPSPSATPTPTPSSSITPSTGGSPKAANNLCPSDTVQIKTYAEFYDLWAVKGAFSKASCNQSISKIDEATFNFYAAVCRYPNDTTKIAIIAYPNPTDTIPSYCAQIRTALPPPSTSCSNNYAYVSKNDPTGHGNCPQVGKTGN